MNQNRVIIFKDGSIVYITEDQEIAILQAMSRKMKHIQIDGQTYELMDMRKILSLEAYNEQYPQKQKKGVKQLYPNQYNVDQLIEPQGLPVERRIRRLKGIIKGLNIYINSPDYKGTGEPMKLVEKYQKKLDALQP